MKPEQLYTPDTLDLIRNGARARDLGWSEDRYLTCCRKHGLIPMAEPTFAPLPPKIETAPPITPTPTPKPTSESSATGPCTLNPITRYLERGQGWGIVLPRRQSEVFAIIADGTPENPIKGRVIAARLRMGSEGIGGHVNILRGKLFALNIKIDSSNGQHGGYWLTDLLTEKPVEVVLI